MINFKKERLPEETLKKRIDAESGNLRIKDLCQNFIARFLGEIKLAWVSKV